MKVSLWLVALLVLAAFVAGYFVEHIGLAQSVRSAENERYSSNREAFAKELIKIRADIENDSLTIAGLNEARKRLRVGSDVYLLQVKSSVLETQKTCFSEADDLISTTSTMWTAAEMCTSKCSGLSMDMLRSLNSAKQKIGECLDLIKQ
jgi:hypothetical protein